MYKEIVGHVGEAMKRRYSKQRMENKRGAMDAMCRKQIDLCKNDAVKALEKIGPKPPAAEGLLLGWSAAIGCRQGAGTGCYCTRNDCESQKRLLAQPHRFYTTTNTWFS
jgi:hypothetical protein